MEEVKSKQDLLIDSMNEDIKRLTDRKAEMIWIFWMGGKQRKCRFSEVLQSMFAIVLGIRRTKEPVQHGDDSRIHQAI